MFGVGIEHDIIDGDVERVFGKRRLDLVGAAEQYLWPLELFVHLDDVAFSNVADFFLADVESGDFLVDFSGHDVLLFSTLSCQNLP